MSLGTQSGIKIESFENRVSLKPVLGAWPVLHISLLIMNRLNKSEFAIFIFFDVVLAPKGYG